MGERSDSVRATLAGQALDRIGRIDAALIAGDRFFGEHARIVLLLFQDRVELLHFLFGR